jgi:ABC-type polysaccharide/polyol phosphate export permease/tetratricopeptide (TPR) repeat protein
MAPRAGRIGRMADPSVRAPITFETSLAEVRAALAAGARDGLDDTDLMVASEIAYQNSDYEAGIIALLILVARTPNDASYHARLGLFQRLSGDTKEAIRNFKRALALDPRIEGAYAELRELLLRAEDFNGAIELLARQESVLGGSPQLQLSRVLLLRRAGRIDEAIAALQRLIATGDAHEEALRMAAETAFASRRLDEALKFAADMMAKFPNTRANRVLFAHILCAARKFDDAIPILQDLLKSKDDDVEALRLLGTALAEVGRFREALAASIRTTKLSPRSSEYWYHASALANILGHTEEALDWIVRARALDPDNTTILTAHAHLLAQLGRLDEAVSALDRATELNPRDASIQDLRLMLLARLTEEFVAPGERSDLIKPLPAGRRVSYGEGSIAAFVEGARIQCRVILALVIREISHRTVYSRFGLMSALIEPVLQIVMLGVVLTIFNNGRAPIGNNLFFFYSTGVMPFYLMLHVVDHTMNIYTENASVLQVSRIRRIDLVVAVALTELLIGAMTTTLIFSLFFAFGYGETLDNISAAVAAYLAVWLFAFGVGFIGSVVNNLTKLWQQSWITVSRMLYFLSGIFFIPQMMPDWARDIVVWNPLLVGIEWFRSGFFPGYSPPWIHRTYMVGVSLACIIVGAALERALRRRLRTTP